MSFPSQRDLSVRAFRSLIFVSPFVIQEPIKSFFAQQLESRHRRRYRALWRTWMYLRACATFVKKRHRTTATKPYEIISKKFCKCRLNRWKNANSSLEMKHRRWNQLAGLLQPALRSDLECIGLPFEKLPAECDSFSPPIEGAKNNFPSRLTVQLVETVLRQSRADRPKFHRTCKAFKLLSAQTELVELCTMHFTDHTFFAADPAWVGPKRRFLARFPTEDRCKSTKIGMYEQTSLVEPWAIHYNTIRHFPSTQPRNPRTETRVGTFSAISSWRERMSEFGMYEHTDLSNNEQLNTLAFFANKIEERPFKIPHIFVAINH